VKSTEFEAKDRYESTLIDRGLWRHIFQLIWLISLFLENDFDDYADRIFNYLGEACSRQPPTSSSPPDEINQINSSSHSIIPTHSSDKEIKPFLCTFCPYFTRNLQEFQIHIAKHTEKNFRCLLCNCM
jgi:hypothetical protein